MIDFFSERFTDLYIRAAVAFAALTGVAQILLPVLAPDVLSKWAIPEGILVLALAVGVWKRNLPSAIGLAGLKLASALLFVSASGRPTNSTVLYQVLIYGLAAAAIYFGRSNQRRRAPSAAPRGHDGEAK